MLYYLDVHIPGKQVVANAVCISGERGTIILSLNPQERGFSDSAINHIQASQTKPAVEIYM